MTTNDVVGVVVRVPVVSVIGFVVVILPVLGTVVERVQDVVVLVVAILGIVECTKVVEDLEEDLVEHVVVVTVGIGHETW